jgi:hypothetical protein
MTLTSETSIGKDSKFSDLEALHMPLPPPPSYAEISMHGPVRSVSGSSWVTEGPIEVEEPPRGGRMGRSGVLRFAARGRF